MTPWRWLLRRLKGRRKKAGPATKGKRGQGRKGNKEEAEARRLETINERLSRAPAYEQPKPDCILIVGGSHTTALAGAVDEEESQRFTILNLRYKRFVSFSTDDMITPRLAKVYQPSRVFSMIGGNSHHVLGLVEHAKAFDLYAPEGPPEPERNVILYGLLEAALTARMEPYLKQMTSLKGLFDVPMCHILPPPPQLEEDHIIENPGAFGNKVARGINPPAIRMKLYNMQSRLLLDHCHNLGMEVLTPPPQALDEKGFLLAPYRRDDPTHANELYGRLVLEQIKERVLG